MTLTNGRRQRSHSFLCTEILGVPVHEETHTRAPRSSGFHEKVGICSPPSPRCHPGWGAQSRYEDHRPWFTEESGGPRGHGTRQAIQFQSSHTDLNTQPANPGSLSPVCTCCAASSRTTPPAPFPIWKVSDHVLRPHSALRGPLRLTPYLCGLKTGQSSLRRPQTPKPARRTEKERV